MPYDYNTPEAIEAALSVLPVGEQADLRKKLVSHGLLPSPKEGALKEGYQGLMGGVVQAARGFAGTLLEAGVPGGESLDLAAREIESRTHQYDPYEGYSPTQSLTSLPALARTAGQAVGSTAPGLIGGIAGGAVAGPAGAWLGGFSTIFGQQYGSTIEEYRQKLPDMSEADRTKLAILYSVFNAAVEQGFGPQAIVARSFKNLAQNTAKKMAGDAAEKVFKSGSWAAVKDMTKAGIKAMLESAWEEGGEEAVQLAGNHLILALGGAAPKDLPGIKEYIENTVGGIVGGAFLGAPAGVFEGATQRVEGSRRAKYLADKQAAQEILAAGQRPPPGPPDGGAPAIGPQVPGMDPLQQSEPTGPDIGEQVPGMQPPAAVAPVQPVAQTPVAAEPVPTLEQQADLAATDAAAVDHPLSPLHDEVNAAVIDAVNQTGKVPAAIPQTQDQKPANVEAQPPAEQAPAAQGVKGQVAPTPAPAAPSRRQLAIDARRLKLQIEKEQAAQAEAPKPYSGQVEILPGRATKNWRTGRVLKAGNGQYLVEYTDRRTTAGDAKSIAGGKVYNPGGKVSEWIDADRVRHPASKATRQQYIAEVNAEPEADRPGIRKAAHEFDNLVRGSETLYDWRQLNEDTGLSKERSGKQQWALTKLGREAVADALGIEGDIHSPVVRSRHLEALKAWLAGPGKTQETAQATEQQKAQVEGEPPAPVWTRDLRDGDQVQIKGAWRIVDVDDELGTVTLRDGTEIELDPTERVSVAGGEIVGRDGTRRRPASEDAGDTSFDFAPKPAPPSTKPQPTGLRQTKLFPAVGQPGHPGGIPQGWTRRQAAVANRQEERARVEIPEPPDPASLPMPMPEQRTAQPTVPKLTYDEAMRQMGVDPSAPLLTQEQQDAIEKQVAAENAGKKALQPSPKSRRAEALRKRLKDAETPAAPDPYAVQMENLPPELMTRDQWYNSRSALPGRPESRETSDSVWILQLFAAARDHKPIAVDAVNAIGLPSNAQMGGPSKTGYVIEGDRYVYKGEATATPQPSPKSRGDQALRKKMKAAPDLATATDADLDAEFADLARQMREQLNRLGSGVDPTIAVIGTKMAYNRVQKGARQFARFAAEMRAALPEQWDAIKAYLHGFWTLNRQHPDFAADEAAIEDITGTQAKAVIAAEDAAKAAETVAPEVPSLSDSQPTDEQYQQFFGRKPSNPHETAVANNLVAMGTPIGEWSALPMEGAEHVPDERGFLHLLPQYDFSAVKDYKHAPTIYPMSQFETNCEWCSHPAKDLFTIVNRSRKLIMQVGSECIKSFSEQSGKEMVADVAQEQVTDTLGAAEKARSDLRSVFQRSQHAGYGRYETVWAYQAARVLHEALLKVQGNVKADSSASAKTLWTRRNGDEAKRLIAEATTLLNAPETIQRRIKNLKSSILELNAKRDRAPWDDRTLERKTAELAKLENQMAPEKTPAVPAPVPVSTPVVTGPTVIPYSKTLVIRNADALPRGVGARYLEVVEGEDGAYIAKQWRRRKESARGAKILVDMEPDVKAATPEVAVPRKPRELDDNEKSILAANDHLNDVLADPDKVTIADLRRALGNLQGLRMYPIQLQAQRGEPYNKDLLSSYESEAENMRRLLREREAATRPPAAAPPLALTSPTPAELGTERAGQATAKNTYEAQLRGMVENPAPWPTWAVEGAQKRLDESTAGKVNDYAKAQLALNGMLATVAKERARLTVNSGVETQGDLFNKAPQNLFDAAAQAKAAAKPAAAAQAEAPGPDRDMNAAQLPTGEPWKMTLDQTRTELGRLESGTIEQWNQSPLVREMYPDAPAGRVDYTSLSRRYREMVARHMPATTQAKMPAESTSPAAPVYDEDYTGPRWTYGLVNRPMQIGAQPKGYIVGSNRPSPAFKNFGTVQYPRQLTDEEVASYELKPVGQSPGAKAEEAAVPAPPPPANPAAAALKQAAEALGKAADAMANPAPAAAPAQAEAPAAPEAVAAPAPAAPVAEATEPGPDTYYYDREEDRTILDFRKKTYDAMPAEDKDHIKRYFLWSRTRGTWMSKAKGPSGPWGLQAIAERAGLTKIEPQGDRMTVEEQFAKQAGRAKDRADRAEDRAAKRTDEARSLGREAESHRGDIAFWTQPNVGSSGGRSFTRQRERIIARLEKSWEKGAQATHWTQEAGRLRENASQKQLDDPGYLTRRIQENEADMRRIEARWKQIEEAPGPDAAAVERDIENLTDRAEVVADKLNFFRSRLEAIGGTAFSRENVKVGDVILSGVRGVHRGTVVRVNPTGVTYRPDSAPMLELKSLYAEIKQNLSAEKREAEDAQAPQSPVTTPAEQVPAVPAQPTRQTVTADRLETMAQKMEDAANESLSTDRLANTPKRARQAASADAQATAQITFARTLKRVAAGIRDGTVKALVRLRNKAQLEALQTIARETQEYRPNGQGRGPVRPDQATFPEPFMPNDGVLSLARELDEIRGGKKVAGQLRRYGSGPGMLTLPRDLAESILALKPRSVPWAIAARLADAKRLEGMGITNSMELQDAIRELTELQGEAPRENAAMAMRRALVGQNVGIDYFPTPPALAGEVVRKADIRAGNTVLEPSAGDGQLANRVRAEHPGTAVDVIETSDSLRNVLKAEGHNIVGQDFMEYTGPQVDRIVMNPPFSRNEDIRHVRHAYNMLKPGGRLVAIMSEHGFFAKGTDEQGFRDWLENHNADVEKNPDGSFMDRSVGPNTGVATRTVVIDKPPDSTAKYRTAAETDAEGVSPLGFYSQVARTVAAARQGRMPGPQWAAWLRNQPGIKAEELDWLGLPQWLAEQQGPVTKEAVQAFVDQNQVRLEEKVLEEEDTGIVETWWNDEGGANEETPYSQLTERERQDAINRYREEVGAYAEGAPKFGKYQLPGVTGYREMLLTMPPKSVRQFFVAYKNGPTMGSGYPSEQDARAEMAETFPGRDDLEVRPGVEERATTTKTPENFTSSHWDEPNVVAHVRFNERTDADGKRVLFVEEVQSDWHQAGRERGYASADAEPLRDAVSRELYGQPYAQLDANTQNAVDIEVQAREQGTEGAAGVAPATETVPNAPFKTTWPLLAMKRVLRYAAANGFDRVAWTPGAVQAERYDLSKQVREITLNDNTSGGATRPRMEGPFERGNLTARDLNGREVINQYINSPEELPGIIGKEAARKLLDVVPTEGQSAGLGVRVRRLAGLELSVGGEGMAGFYDAILPAEINKYTKKWGGRVGENRLAGTDRGDLVRYPKAAWAATGLDPVHSLDITPAMKAAALAGQPLFRLGAAPSVSAMLSSATRREQAAARALWRRIVGTDNIEFVDRLFAGGKDRLGRYQDQWATIVAGKGTAADTTLHEAVHAALDMFMDPQDRADLIQAAGGEEKLAEGIINYARARAEGRSVIAALKQADLGMAARRLVEKLYQALTRLFRVNEMTGKTGMAEVEGFYDNLLNGYYAREGRAMAQEQEAGQASAAAPQGQKSETYRGPAQPAVQQQQAVAGVPSAPKWKRSGVLRQDRDGMWEMSDNSITPQPTLRDAVMSILEANAGYHFKIRPAATEGRYQTYLADYEMEYDDQPIVLDFSGMPLADRTAMQPAMLEAPKSDIRYRTAAQAAETAQKAAAPAQAAADKVSQGWVGHFLDVMHRQDSNYRPDITKADRLLRTIAHFADKVPALKLIYRAALDFATDRHLNGETIFGVGEHLIGDLVKFSRADPDATAKVKAYLLEQDRNAIGPRVKQEGDLFVVYDSAGQRRGQSPDEKQAWYAAHLTETQELQAAGFSDAAAEAVFKYRTIADNTWDMLATEWRQIIAEREAMGLPPTIPLKDGSAIDLRLALAQIGDRRGYYMPRLRKNGTYVLHATKPGGTLTAAKQGETDLVESFTADRALKDRRAELENDGWQVSGEGNNLRRQFDTAAGRAAAVTNLERDGYTVELSLNKTLPESVYLDVNSASLEAAINAALEKIGTDVETGDFAKVGLKAEYQTYPRKTDGLNERHFVVKGPFNPRNVSVFKDFGGYPNREEDSWHFPKPGKDIKRDMLRALLHVKYGQMIPSEAFAQTMAESMAEILQSRGSQARKITRSEATGEDVWAGYEKDPFRAIAMAGKSTAAGAAKKQMVQKMMAALTGRDESWDDFKARRLSEGAAEAADSETDSTPIGARLWNEYNAQVQERRIDPATQREAFDFSKTYIREMSRNEEPSERVVGIIKGLAVLKYLSGVAPAAVNLTALATSVPAMMHGMARIPVTRIPMLVSRGIKDYSRYYLNRKFGVSQELTGDNAWLFNEINRRGWDEQQLNREALGAMSTWAESHLNWIVQHALIPFGVTERINRASTIAATFWGLAEKKYAKDQEVSADDREAFLTQAKEVSDKAHGVYGKPNLPEMAMGGNLGSQGFRTFYVFKTFTHNYLQLLEKFGVQERDAVTTLIFMLSPAMIAGVGAIPAKDLLKKILQALLEAVPGYEPPDDIEEVIYAAAERAFGPVGERIARSGLAGMTGFDLRGSLSIGVTDIPTNIGDLLGAPWSVMKDVGGGISAMAHGDVMKGAEKLLPRILAAPVKAVREATEGVTTASNQPVYYGNKKLQASMTEAAIRAAGFSPSRLATIREKQWNERQTAQEYDQQRSDIYRRVRGFYNQSAYARDPEDWADILGLIEGYNARVTRNGSPSPYITPEALRRIATQMGRPPRREAMRGGLIQREEPLLPETAPDEGGRTENRRARAARRGRERRSRGGFAGAAQPRGLL